MEGVVFVARVQHNYRHKDFSYLLQPQGAQVELAAEEVAETTPVVSAERRRRDSLLSNRKFKYVISKSGMIHDRDCSVVARISDEDFDMCSDYPDGKAICFKCYRKAMIRRGLQPEQAKYIEAALSLFNRLNVGNREINHLFIKHNATIKEVGKDSLCLKVNEDCWIIQLVNGKCLLFHNNYYMLNKTERLLCKEFHKQTRNPLSFEEAALFICEYTWEGHLKNKEERLKAQQREALKKELAGVCNIRRIPKLSLLFNYYDILDWEDWTAEEIQKKKLPIKELKQPDKTATSHAVVRCRVPRWKDHCIHRLADALKEYCAEQLFFFYPKLCQKEFGGTGDPYEK